MVPAPTAKNLALLLERQLSTHAMITEPDPEALTCTTSKGQALPPQGDTYSSGFPNLSARDPKETLIRCFARDPS